MHEVSKSMGLIFSNLIREKTFQIGLVIKLIFILFFLPIIHIDWFIPFISSFLQDPTLSPWDTYIETGGDLLAFPYGPVMFFVYLPLSFIGSIIDDVTGSEYFLAVGFQLTILLADIFVLISLIHQFNQFSKKLIIYYWLSPLVLFISYWHGQIDLIPIAFLFFSLDLLKNGNYKLGGAFIALSITAKYSMLIGLPIILIYLWLNQNLRGGFWQTIISFVICSSFIFIPFLFTSGFWEMVIYNRDTDKIFTLSILLGNDLKIYLLPTFYLAFLYYAWRMLRMNYELLLATLAVGFSIVIFLTPPPPGWLIWLVPLYAIHQSKNSGGANYLIALFSLFFISYHSIYSSGANIIGFENLSDYVNFNFTLFEIPQIRSIFNTLVVSFGLLIGIQIYREGIQGNDYYHLGMKPLVIGITGDSGTGKSTFTESITTLFGRSSTVNLEGDDYHNWDRKSPMWKSITHLNPRSNRLFDLVNDLRKLLDGSAVNSISYNHLTGLFSAPKLKASKNLILISGLHSLYLKSLVDEIDKSFYLTMDEDLRVALKVKRDIARGRSEEYTLNEIEKRREDSIKYIQPQSQRADVIFKIMPINKDEVQNQISDNIRLKLGVIIKSCPYYTELIRTLTGICNLQVNLNEINEIGGVDIEIQGDVDREDIKLATNILAPRIDELIDIKNGLSSGILGVMELIALVEVNDYLTIKKRRNNA